MQGDALFMPAKTRIKLTNIIAKLPEEAVDSLYETACRMFEDYPNDERPCCPYCNGNAIVRNGHKCGKQEYRCKTCGKTFVSTTNTLMANSHQPREIWESVINDTLAGEAIDFTAKRLELTHDLVYRMRHKFLLALSALLEEQCPCLQDVTEMDETYVLESYKGKQLPDSVCRKPRRHGAKAEKRGISSEYICICTGAQRKGSVIAGSVNRAKPSSQELLEVFSGHIAGDTLILCDGLKSYKALEAAEGCIIKDVTSETTGRGFYNLNTVNAFHSFIKRQYVFYRGVATKYLNRYNALFSAAYKCTEERLRQILSALLTVSGTRRWSSCRDIKTAGLLLI